jgi:hypothetical protein
MFSTVKIPKKNRVILPEEYNVRPLEKIICTMDTETDPFAPNRIVRPFCVGFYCGEFNLYRRFWGDDCIEQFFTFLANNFQGIDLCIYVHNGGNFDFYFCHKYFDDGMKPFIINGRLVRIFMQGQEFRDSYAAIPVALAKMGEGAKGVIDYDKMERPVREANKGEILTYLKQDCVSLYDYIKAWTDKNGNKLTMASAALPRLREYHGFENMREKEDNQLRPYYFGGRVECFETGELHGDWKIYDVNSMYPYVMAAFKHPVSATPEIQTRITEKTHFAHITACSKGALPIRSKHGLEFPHGINEFFACKYEIEAGLETGTLKILKVHSAFKFDAMSDFSIFIEETYARRIEARQSGDSATDLFSKLEMNSSYGKFAQDPRKYKDYIFNPDEIPLPLICWECNGNAERNDFRPCSSCGSGTTDPYGWYCDTIRDGACIYARGQRRNRRNFFNVATAASITSASRAVLFRAISASERPIYCDTDSLICNTLDSHIDASALGGWKLEATGNVAYIAGKKLYAVFNGKDEIKKASKGVRLTAEQIARVANGDVIEYANPVPKFSLGSPVSASDVAAYGGSASFVTRKIARTSWE